MPGNTSADRVKGGLQAVIFQFLLQFGFGINAHALLQCQAVRLRQQAVYTSYCARGPVPSGVYRASRPALSFNKYCACGCCFCTGTKNTVTAAAMHSSASMAAPAGSGDSPRQLVTHGQKPPSILWYSQIHKSNSTLLQAVCPVWRHPNRKKVKIVCLLLYFGNTL